MHKGWVLVAGILIGALLVAMPPPASLLRKDVSSGTVEDAKSESRTLAALVDGKPHALLLISSALPAELCPAVLDEVKRVRTFGLEVTLAWTSLGQKSCGTVPVYTPGRQLREIMATSQSAAEARAVVLDGSGVVRLDETFEASVAQIKRVADKLIAWRQGAQSFAVHCGHCHDDDGANTSHAGIKTLVGISTRMSDAKILEGGEMFGAVSIYAWKKSEVDSLLLFIRGL